MNQITLMGYLGKDAKLNQQGDCISFQVATKDSWKDEDGSWQSRTDWHLCKFYTKHFLSYIDLKKGQRVLLTGKQRNVSLQDDHGDFVNFSSVQVKKVEILDKKKLNTSTEEIPF